MIVAMVAAAALAAAPVLVRCPGLMASMVSATVSRRVPAVVSTRISRRVAVAISTMILACVAVVVRATVMVMIVAYNGPNSRESRILAQAGIIVVSPFPIFVPAFTAQPVVIDVAVVAFGEPLAVARVFVGVPPGIAVAVIRVVGGVAALSASGDQQQSQRQSCYKQTAHIAVLLPGNTRGFQNEP